MKLVRESINFERGMDPKAAMGIGDVVSRAVSIVQKSIDRQNDRFKPEYQWKRFKYQNEIEWNRNTHNGPDETIRANFDHKTLSYKMYTVDIIYLKAESKEPIEEQIIKILNQI